MEPADAAAVRKRVEAVKAATPSAPKSTVDEVGAAEGAAEGVGGTAERTRFVAETLLPTDGGHIRMRAYACPGTALEPVALVSGDIASMESVPVRVHDQCLTSEVFGSLKCDCKQQLGWATEYIRQHGGVVIYLQQEGRGIGLAFKLAAYSLQEKGADTVDANRLLGLPDDCRSYWAAADVLSELGVSNVALMTNNPRKVRLLEALGVSIGARIPIVLPSTPFSEDYLRTKAKRMDHMLPTGEEGGGGGGGEGVKEDGDGDDGVEEEEEEEEEADMKLDGVDLDDVCSDDSDESL